MTSQKTKFDFFRGAYLFANFNNTAFRKNLVLSIAIFCEATWSVRILFTPFPPYKSFPKRLILFTKCWKNAALCTLDSDLVNLDFWSRYQFYLRQQAAS